MDESLPQVWFAPKVTLEQIQRCFELGKEEVRIATGFFTIYGWNLLRKSIGNKKVYLLVGIDEPGEDKAREMIVKGIIEDLAVGVDSDRIEAVRDLVNRIEGRHFSIVDARASKHHGKAYLVDEDYLIITSANCTRRGFKEQNEIGNLVTDEAQTKKFKTDFNLHFTNAVDLTQELLTALKKWLEFHRPWDIYLKTMLCLENIRPTKRHYKEPANFQRDIIAKVLRSLRKHNGAFLIASTGLGKTVVATYVALQLFEANEIDNIIVIGPKQIHKMWDDELRLASLRIDFFTYYAIDQSTYENDSSLIDFERIAEELFDERWLLIFDESHFLRISKADNGQQRTAFKRLLPLIKKSKCKVLTLTGSPYSTELFNINNQLLLLPHTAQSNVLFPEFFSDANAWSIHSLDEFTDLPVASLMSMPHVAKYYGKMDKQGLYIMYGEDKKYIPNVTLNRVDFNLILEEEISNLLSNQFFKEKTTISGTSVENEIRIAWSSSLQALKEVLIKVLETPHGDQPFEVDFVKSFEERVKIIKPIIRVLEKTDSLKDIKFLALKEILLKNLGQKIIIFCERLTTVVYLEKCIKKEIPSISIFTTVRKTKSKYDIKHDGEIFKGLYGFAPESNAWFARNKKLSSPTKKNQSSPNHDILITTDAFGVGINLQDASVVINYDTAWTPISPIQRAGRVLRPWREPRTIEIYTFVPQLVSPINDVRELDLVGIRWQNLKNRHDESQQVIEMPVLPEEVTKKIYMPEVASTVTIRSVPLDLEEISDIEVSTYFIHTSILQQNREHAKNLRDDITSALAHKGTDELIYLLFCHEEMYKWLVYNIGKKKLTTLSDIQLLDLIQCTEETERAFVNPNKIEKCSEEAIKFWCQANQVNSDDITRICTLFLQPQATEKDVSGIFPDQELTQTKRVSIMQQLLPNN